MAAKEHRFDQPFRQAQGKKRKEAVVGRGAVGRDKRGVRSYRIKVNPTKSERFADIGGGGVAGLGAYLMRNARMQEWVEFGGSSGSIRPNPGNRGSGLQFLPPCSRRSATVRGALPRGAFHAASAPRYSMNWRIRAVHSR